MIKIWLMIMFISGINYPSVKYQTIIYKTEEECVNALADYFNYYEKKSDAYKLEVVTDAHCLEFESFPIKGLKLTRT
mgnify:CR=1 FL=1